MSYKERLTHLEQILKIDKLSKKYNLKARSSSYSSRNNSSSNASTPSSTDDAIMQQQQLDTTQQLESNNEIPSPTKDATVEQGAEPALDESIVSNGGGGGDVNEDDNRVELNELKKLVFHGLPGDNQYRALVWRLLLNYLPPNSIDLWDDYLAKKRSNYQHFVNDLLSNTSDGSNYGSGISDHPLNPEPDSKWQIFFKDNDVLLQIDKDVRRLCPEISFFQTQTPYPNEHIVSGKMDRLHKRVQSCVLESSSVIRKGLGVTKLISKDGSNSNSTNLFPHPPPLQAPNSTPNLSFTSSAASTNKNSSILSTSSTVSSLMEESNGSQNQLNTSTLSTTSAYSLNNRKTSLVDTQQDEYHWEVVERILFIYAKLNPGQSYVQGMNEIIGPIYYTLANDPNLLWREYAEADTFYLFTNLMGEIRDFFIRSLDNSVSGIKRMMELLMERLNARDGSVHARLVGLEIHPQYYAFRWITLLMSQEFPLPEVLRIWDSLLSDPKRFDFLIDLASAMIIHVRSDLLSGDFPSNMKLLQNYPLNDVRDILRLASSFNCVSSSNNGTISSS